MFGDQTKHVLVNKNTTKQNPLDLEPTILQSPFPSTFQRETIFKKSTRHPNANQILHRQFETPVLQNKQNR